MGISTYVGEKARLLTVLIAVLGLAAIFILSWHVPSPVPSTSMSYTYGFNNNVAILAMAALLAALFLVFLQKRRGEGYNSTARALSCLLFDEASARNSKGYRISFFVILCLIPVIQVIWYGILTYRKFGEYRFFIGRLDLMALGFKPYRDFQFIYGPAMLYPAHWLYKISGGDLPVDDAYIITLVAHWMAGIYLLYYVIGNLNGRLNKTVVFLCIALASFNISMGLNYTLLRFITPIASLVFLHRTFVHDTKWSVCRFLKFASFAFLLPAVSFSISPEMGVATLVGVMAYFIALLRTPLRVWSWLGALPVLSLVASVVIFSKDYMDVFSSRLIGSETLPVFPTLHFLVFVGAACWLLPQLGILGVCERNQNGAFAMALLLCFGCQIPTSMGRCDSGHIFFNSLGVFILLLAVGYEFERKWLPRSLVTVFVIVFPLLGWAITWDATGPVLVDAINRRPKPDAPGAADDEFLNYEKWRLVSRPKNQIIYRKIPPFEPDLMQLLRYKKIGMPFECSAEIDCFIKLSGRYLPEYYSNPVMQVFTQAAIDRKLLDLLRMDVILIPKKNTIYLGQINAVKSAAYDSLALKQILFFPVSFAPSSRQLLPNKQIMEKISADYGVIGEFRDNLILARKDLQKSQVLN
jgi:hypothetical protein